MKISLLENGMDSLQQGFKKFLEFEKSTIDAEPGLRDYFNLKQAVLSLHHGIEILMKYILSKKSEFLIISKIDKNYMQAYHDKEKFNKATVFETEHADTINTISFEEALLRLKYFQNEEISKDLQSRLNKLNKIRNALTHAEINIEDDEITGLFNEILDDIDILFYKAIGKQYKTLSGYSDLKNNYEKYMEILEQKGLSIKIKAIKEFTKAIEAMSISIGNNDIKQIEDINTVKKFIKVLKTSTLKLGMDMYNGYCSGDIEIDIEDDSHLSLYAKDIKCKYIFKFKSMILHFPAVLNNKSPVIIFECDNDNFETDNNDMVQDDFFDGKRVEGIFLENENRMIYDLDKIY